MNITKLSVAIAMAFGMTMGTAYAQNVSPSEIQRTTPGAQQPQGGQVNRDELSDPATVQGQPGEARAAQGASDSQPDSSQQGSQAGASQQSGGAQSSGTAAGDQMNSGEADRSAGAGQGGQGAGGAGGEPGKETTGQGQGVKESGGTAEAQTPGESGGSNR